MALSYSLLAPKVLQFGGGNFLRAFLGWMVQHLNETEEFAGSIVLVKPTPGRDYTSLRQNAGQYHVLLNGIQGGEAKQSIYPINCISQIIQPYQQWDDFLQSARHVSMRYVVSNTTEAGIVFEGEAHYREAVPNSFPGKLTAWLYERYRHFAQSPASGCILLPCELLPDNGSLLRRTILQYASHWGLEADFVSWVNLHNHFCDTLVDRIVSGYDAKVAEDISDQLAFPDPNLVVGEHYHSWVIKSEASIRDQLPFLASGLNNSWTDDLQLYRQRKVRILNGAHMTIVPLGHMLGLKTVKEAMDHPALSNFLEALLSEEVIPSIDLDEEQLQAYKEDILDRFRNPFLEHRLLDIALNSISKFAARLLPTLVDRYQQTGQIPHKILRVWLAVILFYRGTYQGAEIPLRDEESNLRFFADLWQKSQAFREAEILQHALQHALQCPAWQHDQLPPSEQLLAEMLPLWQQWDQEGLLSLISTPQTSN